MTSEPTDAQIEAGARAYCLAIGIDDPDEFILEETPQWVAYIAEARAIYTAMRSSLPNPEGMTEALNAIVALADECAKFDADNLKACKEDKANANAFTFTTHNYWSDRATLSAKFAERVREIAALSTRSEGQVTEAAIFDYLQTEFDWDDVLARKTAREIAALASTRVEPDRSQLVNIEGDEIVMRVPISTIQHAASAALWEMNLTVTDERKAAAGVVRYLNDEDEEGSTLLHFALDKALRLAVENGEEGFSDDE